MRKVVARVSHLRAFQKTYLARSRKWTTHVCAYIRQDRSHAASNKRRRHACDAPCTRPTPDAARVRVRKLQDHCFLEARRANKNPVDEEEHQQVENVGWSLGGQERNDAAMLPQSHKRPAMMVASTLLIATRCSTAFAPGTAMRMTRTALRTMHSTSPPQSSWAALFSTKEEVDPGVVEGTDLRVLKYPHPSLRRENEVIPDEELTGPGCETSKIAKEMFLVMYATNGVGLAAPQVGINKRLMVYNDTGDPKKWMKENIFVNPKIVEYSDAKDIETEGCLSFPDMDGDVQRSKWIKIEAQNLKGKKIKKKFKGWEARVFQHEYDHLEKTVYIDRLTDEGRKEVQPRLNELIEEFGEGGEL